MRSTLQIADPLFVSAPNGGGVSYVHRHLILPLNSEDATGLAALENGLLWCVQTPPFNSIKEVRGGVFRKTILSDCSLDLHDVAIGPDGTYAVFTETNEVVRLDERYEVVQRWSFGTEIDSAHVNCIVWFQGRLLASLFGAFNDHRGYKGRTKAAGRIVDVHTGAPLIVGLSQPHSLVEAENELWLCSSEDRAVHVYDVNFVLRREVSLPGYARGLALGPECVYVGLSRSRNTQGEDVGEFANAVIAVLDRRSLAVVGYLPMSCNEIYDIRIVSSEQVAVEVMASLWAREREDQSKILDSAIRAVELKFEHQLLQARLTQLDKQRKAETQLAQLRQELENSMREVAQQKNEIEIAEIEINQVTSSRYWRWTWPARAAMQLLRGRGLIGRTDRHLAEAAKRRVRWLRSHLLSAQVPKNKVSGPTLAAAEVDRPDVFIWAIIDWDYRTQRPQHLATELAARGHRVFYVSNNFVDQAEAGFRVDALDDQGRLFRVQLHLSGAPGIYYGVPGEAALHQLGDSVGCLLAWTRTRAALSLIHHPFWRDTARILPNQRVIYDCMDHHGGFSNNSAEVLAWDHDLMRIADLLVVTSDWLYEEAGRFNKRRRLVRNACQFEHFSTLPKTSFRDLDGRPVIGYFGAIAEWMDLNLLEKLAERFSGCLILMIGMDSVGAQTRLRHFENVKFIGEVPYANLPFYLATFDVCLLPFQVIPLTTATNPVKIYEYLSAGKEVVAIDLPEMRQFGNLVRTASSHSAFLDEVAKALGNPKSEGDVVARQDFAVNQTWVHRVGDLLMGVNALEQPRVSIIVVTYNNVGFTKACLRSLEMYCDYANTEIIVVDNASTDDTCAYLASWARADPGRRVLFNEENRGFAVANNQGLAVASGDYLVLLNNDTYVTPGWINTLIAHLKRSKELGMIGPVTNNIGNEARIPISYSTMEEMIQVAADYTLRHAGKRTPLRTAAFFCVMLRRAVYQQVGSLDEAFGLGFFEDDDYCRRVEQAGWKIACADDVFIHHHLSASFNNLKQETRQELFAKNKLIYEAKWGEWLPHAYRHE